MARSMEHAPWPSRTGWTPRQKDGANASWRALARGQPGRHTERRSKRCRRSPRRAPRTSSSTGRWRIDTRTSTATRSTSCRSARTSTGRRCSGAARRQLPVPALGICAQGRVTFRFADREEVFEAGARTGSTRPRAKRILPLRRRRKQVSRRRRLLKGELTFRFADRRGGLRGRRRLLPPARPRPAGAGRERRPVQPRRGAATVAAAMAKNMQAMQERLSRPGLVWVGLRRRRSYSPRWTVTLLDAETHATRGAIMAGPVRRNFAHLSASSGRRTSMPCCRWT